MSGAEHPERAEQLLAALDMYRPARQKLLATLGLPASNRDPFAELSEQLVHALMGGLLAESRVQAGHDLVLLDGMKVQARYLANPSSDTWINEHRVHQIPGVELYALVLFEAFQVVGVLVFPLDGRADLRRTRQATSRPVGTSAVHTAELVDHPRLKAYLRKSRDADLAAASGVPSRYSRSMTRAMPGFHAPK